MDGRPGSLNSVPKLRTFLGAATIEPIELGDIFP
jgi:hypothetical protein